MLNKHLKMHIKVFTGIDNYITMFTLHSLGILYTSSLNVCTSETYVQVKRMYCSQRTIS